MEYIIGYFEEMQPDLHDFCKQINKFHTSMDVKQRISSLKLVFNWNTQSIELNNKVQFETEWIKNTNY